MSLQTLGGTAGSVVYNLVLRNTGPKPCVLDGYPGVSAVSSSGSQLGAPARRVDSAPVASVALPPGGSATAHLLVADALNYPASTCRPTAALGLKVYPPNQTAADIVAVRGLDVCGASVSGDMTVGPVVTAGA